MKTGSGSGVGSNSKPFTNNRSSKQNSLLQNLWDSPFVRAITGDAISLSLEGNSFSFIGISNEPIGGLFILRGPNAFTFHSYSDVGAGIGVEFSTGISINKYNVLTSDLNQINKANLGGFRVAGSLDVGNGFVGGVNAGFSIPTNSNSPMVFSSGISIGKGVTSPLFVGGNLNVGYTFIH